MPFSFGERLGIFFTIEAACLSAASASLILGLALYKWLRTTVFTRRRKIRAIDAIESSLFLNLMVSDLLQAIGIFPNIKWMSDAVITEGQLCTAQAAIKQVGIVGVSLTSLAIALHTFSILVLRWRAPRHISKFLVIGVWVLTAIIVGIPNAVHRNDNYYGANGYWCWIHREFKMELIVTEYLWVWLAGALMAILYTIMYVVMHGWFIIDRGIHWHKSYNPSDTGAPAPETQEDRDSKAIANLMLFYPAVYIVCILPNSLSRWMYFSGVTPPYQFALFANTLYGLSGMFNLILFFMTRPEIVVGQKVFIEEIPLTHDRKSSANTLGHLPDRNYEDSPSTFENHSQREFDPRVLPDHDLHHSPAARHDTLPARSNSNYLLVEKPQYQRSRGSSSLTENEDYGHLPT